MRIAAHAVHERRTIRTILNKLFIERRQRNPDEAVSNSITVVQLEEKGSPTQTKHRASELYSFWKTAIKRNFNNGKCVWGKTIRR